MYDTIVFMWEVYIMEIGNLERIKTELEKEKLENDEKILKYDERSRMTKVNKFEYKICETIGLTIITYIGLLFFTKSLGIIELTSIFSSVGLIGSSLSISTAIRIFMSKKYKTKERFKSFSNAKTEAEKLEEEIFYEIELKKATNRNRVIDEAINLLSSEHEMISSLSNKYDLVYKNRLKPLEEVNLEIDRLSNFIKEQDDKLNLFTTKQILNDKFWRFRSNFQKFLDCFVVSLFSLMLISLFLAFPLFNNTNTLFISLKSIFIPILTLVNVYMLKRFGDYKKVFNKFNFQLGDNALSDKLKFYESPTEENIKIEKLIVEQIKNISLSLVRLKEQQSFQDLLLKNEAIKHQDKKNSLENKNVQKVLDNMVSYTDEYFSSTEELLPKGHVLVRKRRAMGFDNEEEN